MIAKSPWCLHHLPVDATMLWIKETGSAVLQHEYQCGICYKPRLSLLPQDQGGYTVSPQEDLTDFCSTLALEAGPADEWYITLLTDYWIASKLIGQPFNCLEFFETPSTMEVHSRIAELYSEFETALAVGRMRKQLAVFDIYNKEAISIA